MTKNTASALHSVIYSPKSNLLYLTRQPNSHKRTEAKVKYGIISETKLVGIISVDQYNLHKNYRIGSWVAFVRFRQFRPNLIFVGKIRCLPVR